jgi:flagellar M-ring protein FliF
MNVPYRFGEGNGAILVPADKVYELRMKLTSAGLPKGGEGGYEFLDQSPTFGVTQRRESMNLQRAREGELIRTIQTLDSVAAARVHLAMPNQNGFFREQEKASASVVLTLHPGRTLDRAQVAGIVHLVSRSVPDLKAGDVSVIDHTGALLNPGDGSAGGGNLDAMQLDHRRQVEDGLLKRVLDLLEPVVGRSNLRATVTADIDFSQTESTAEEFRPNQGADATATVRAVRTEETLNGSTATPSGVPGAASNQPPVPATAPINGAAAPLQAAQGGSAGGNGRREAETRYEVDRTVRVTRAGTGVVKRLNAAVVVNHRTTADAKGRSSTNPLTAAELDQLTALVRQGIGFDARRGDSVQVVNAPFHTEPVAAPATPPVWQQPWAQDLLRVGAAPAALALVALVALFGFVRPALKAVAPAAPARGRQIDAVVGDAEALPAPPAAPALQAPATDRRLDIARNLAQQNPAAVANIMRDWVNGEAAS